MSVFIVGSLRVLFASPKIKLPTSTNISAVQMRKESQLLLQTLK